MLTTEYLILAPGTGVASTSKAIDSSTNETVAFHVEDAGLGTSNHRDNQGTAWLQLNSDVNQEDPATQEIHPALRDEPKTTAIGNNKFLPQQNIEPKRHSNEISQPSSAMTDPTESIASTVESRLTEDVDTDSINIDPPEIPPRILTTDEISKHNKIHDMWLVINNEVYDVTQFQHRHPGGPKSTTLCRFRKQSND